MAPITENSTYEDLREHAREQSRILGRYAAVVEITTYMQRRSQTTVMISTTPICSFSRRGGFVGLMCQFRNGQPFGAGPAEVPTFPKYTGDELPF